VDTGGVPEVVALTKKIVIAGVDGLPHLVDGAVSVIVEEETIITAILAMATAGVVDMEEVGADMAPVLDPRLREATLKTRATANKIKIASITSLEATIRTAMTQTTT
jgi:hypothetical protein